MKKLFWWIVSLVMVAGWVYNIVWLLENWVHVHIINKLFHLFTILVFPPLGAVLGYLHYFGVL